MRRTSTVVLVGLAVVAAGLLVASLRVNPYFYFAAYVILQYIVIATAWNILGVVESLMGTFFGPSWSLAVSFGILLVALAVRPAGLFGR